MIDTENETSDSLTSLETPKRHLEVLNGVLSALADLEREDQERIVNTVITFLGLKNRMTISPSASSYASPAASDNQTPLFSEDRSMSPKQFMLEKQPKTDMEKVACLAYYLTHYRGVQHFKTFDISKLNTEAAQVKFANAAVAVDHASRRNYLVQAGKGHKQLSALGEQFVLALPDRDKARAIMANTRPRKKTKKKPATDGDQ